MSFLQERRLPNIWILGADALAIVLAVVLAFLLRFDGSIPSFYLQGGLQGVLALILLTTLVSFWLLRLYSFSWGHVGITDILSLGKAVLASAVVVGVAAIIGSLVPLAAFLFLPIQTAI